MFVYAFQDFAAADISLETRRQLTEAVYNEIITSVVKILDKLDLTSDPNDKSEVCSLFLLMLYVYKHSMMSYINYHSFICTCMLFKKWVFLRRNFLFNI